MSASLPPPVPRGGHVRRLACALLLALALAPLLSPPARAEPDAQALGGALGYPVARGRAEVFASHYRVGSWSAMDQVPGARVRTVARAETPLPLPPAPDAPAFIYAYRGTTHTVDDHLERRRVAGLLILKDGAVVVERYRYGRTPESRFVSFSMAKSVTALLVGIALRRGDIASLDDRAEVYASALRGAPYGGTTIRQLLRMSSGLTFTERYDGQDDLARLSFAAQTGRPDVVEVLRSITARPAPAGERFAYASAETEVLGRVLAGATGRTVAELTRDWLWQPMGAEHEAFWPQRATPFFGYGYQFWLLPLRERSFAMRGVYGQTLYVQPVSGIVMMQTAVYASAGVAPDPEPHLERGALWLGVLRSLGGATD